jgi:hypothetical protein
MADGSTFEVNNLFASSCDNRRPIIAFGTRALGNSLSSAREKTPSGPDCCKSQTGMKLSVSICAFSAPFAQTSQSKNRRVSFHL